MNATNATKEDERVTIAQYIDKQLENEFKDEEAATHEHHDLNETLSKEKVCSGAMMPRPVPSAPDGMCACTRNTASCGVLALTALAAYANALCDHSLAELTRAVT